MGLHDDLDAVNRAWAAAIALKDARAAADQFTPDGVVVVADTPVTRGHEALVALFQAWIDFGMAEEQYGSSTREAANSFYKSSYLPPNVSFSFVPTIA